MDKLYFITGNKNKFEEARSIVGENLEQLEMDLPEIQEMDLHKVIEAKLLEGLKHHQGPIIVEDVSCSFEALDGLPGPFIKFFLNIMGRQKLFEICEKFENDKAEVKACLGFAKDKDNFHYFDGIVHGTIVTPRGKSGFGFDYIFQPNGYEKTYSEMAQSEKNAISHRSIALTKLKEFLKDDTN